MVKFIEPKISEVTISYIGKHVNNPVNIGLCKGIIKLNKKNGYGNEYPVIIFKGCGVEWCYSKDQESIRDEEYSEILSKYS